MSWLEIIGVITNVLGVWLTVRRNMLCWPIGIVGVSVYCYQFLLWKLYSDTALQAFYAVTLLYGWWVWCKDQHSGEQSGLVVTRASYRRFGLEIIFTLASTACVGWVLATFTDDPLPWGDAGLTCFSLLASLWASRRHWESWVLWIVVDTLYAALFFVRHDQLTAWLYVMFTVLAAYGAWQWKTEFQKNIPAVEG
ncbi:nicotinamide mononucleotide transporter [Neokomagataea thailandica NBRC 106555]|uniref:Nicotinamide riboside transporter PnuC n=2 Tax=Neokomagataea TaxID=1223423 RepID=A0A4Y6V785_9PROT|nr:MULTISPECIES: nicotinamide riboside transporter PnuC [Neokomagataea]QDH24718.1 nicotinamide riboside transporter PnuC [Neokomagataea tanensis]GBR53753.1 nicotinamide mononucleotide transporter [Neokomagataea thailandica NBRC 106555]